MFVFTISDIIGIAAFAVCIVIIIGFFIAGGVAKLGKKFGEKARDMKGNNHECKQMGIRTNQM